jgi:4-hydroxy-2-oxoheptanedioate aldolase
MERAQMTQKDPFKLRLRRGDSLHGFFIGHASPALVEMVGYAGFDFAIMDQEHGPIDKAALEGMLRAADAVGITPIVRIPSASMDAILSVLDLGAVGILVPHVTDAAVARHIVEQAYYMPQGKRGISSFGRGAHYGLWKGKYLQDANNLTTVITMVEDDEAVGQAGAIAAVPGVDAVFVGPSDLGASMGHIGERDHPELLAAIVDIAKAVKAVGGVGLATTAQTHHDVPGLNELGYSMICHSTTTTMARGLKALHADLKL